LGRPISESEKTHNLAEEFQAELLEFFDLFSWPFSKEDRPSAKGCVIADVGTRTFSSAPAIEKNFEKIYSEVEIHGYEIDAYRRFTNFRTRADYGHYYSKKVRKGFYHAEDFRKSSRKYDIILMLHPFVTPSAHLAWGLPLSLYDPRDLFAHCLRSLRGETGLFLLSSPREEEYEKAVDLTLSLGFELIDEKVWRPRQNSIQKQMRLGALFKTQFAPPPRSLNLDKC